MSIQSNENLKRSVQTSRAILPPAGQFCIPIWEADLLPGEADLHPEANLPPEANRFGS